MQELPITIKRKILELAKRVPAAAQSDFVRRSADKIGDVALEYPNTIVFSVLGLLVGEIVDNLLTIDSPFGDTVAELTGDHASTILGIAGGAFGLTQDVQSNAIRRKIASILGDELRRALGEGGAHA
jgi:hypothetical protein